MPVLLGVQAKLLEVSPLKIFYSESFLKHTPPFPHPERPERLKIVLKSLEEKGFLKNLEEPPSASLRDLLKIHDERYLKRVFEASSTVPNMLDEDTYISEGSLEAALKAAGAAIKCAALSIKTENVFLALVRPPGHHAGRKGTALGAPSQGFCIFNNVALAAAVLLNRGIERIAIIDFDVHHGNGTQEIFYRDPRVLHIDLHQDPTTIYPGTGFPEDVGEGEGEGSKINIVLPIGSGDDIYQKALEEIVLPILEEFRPEVLLYSAGFDAYREDGLADINATEYTFFKLGEIPREIGVKRVAVVLEGGYSVGLRLGLPAFLLGLTGEAPKFAKPSKSTEGVEVMAQYYFSRLKKVVSKYWCI
ncbi:MAG: histone deacetylase family protein [Thermoproteales archaeon]|nr:histone deacetylase family protein [Thermoproteales archaeon]